MLSRVGERFCRFEEGVAVARVDGRERGGSTVGVAGVALAWVPKAAEEGAACDWESCGGCFAVGLGWVIWEGCGEDAER